MDTDLTAEDSEEMFMESIPFEGDYGEDEGITEELLESLQVDMVLMELPEKQRRRALQKVIKKLTQEAELNSREIEVITHRFGIGGVQKKTLVELGKQYGITKERVRQIEARVLKLLRQAARRRGEG